MTKEELMKQAHVNEIPGGCGSTIKHYSMNKNTIEKHQAKFEKRQSNDALDQRWTSIRPAKEKNKTQAKKVESGRRLDKWQHNDNAINGVAARNYE